MTEGVGGVAEMEFSPRHGCNEYRWKDSGMNALLMSSCLKEGVTVYLISASIHSFSSL